MYPIIYPIIFKKYYFWNESFFIIATNFDSKLCKFFCIYNFQPFLGTDVRIEIRDATPFILIINLKRYFPSYIK